METKLCCCPNKDVVEEKCHNDIYKNITTTFYRFDVDRLRCFKAIRLRTLKMDCNPPQVVNRPCDLNTCAKPTYHLSWTPKNCTCQSGVKVTYAQCCDLYKPYTESSCNAINGSITTKEITYNFNIETGKFEKDETYKSVITICDKPSQKIGACVEDAAGNKYREVISTSYTRHACECAEHITHTREQCGCPPPITTNECVDNDKLISKVTQFTLTQNACTNNTHVSNTSRVELQCTQGEMPTCSCKESKTVFNDMILKNSTLTGSCSNNTKVLTMEKYQLVGCVCKKQFIKIPINCTHCEDSLSEPECLQILNKGECIRTDKSILCQHTCGYCGRHNTELDYHVTPGADLNLPPSDQMPKGKVILEEVPFNSLETCIKNCINHTSCTSFVADQQSNTCRLYHPNVNTLKLIPDDKEPLVFNQQKYYVELRPKHLECPPSTIQQTSGECKCMDILVNGQNGTSNQLCVKNVTVTSYRSSFAESCVKETLNKTALCQPIDRAPSKTCQTSLEKGQCKDKTVNSECQYTCSNSSVTCNRELNVERCVKNGNKTYHMVVDHLKMSPQDGFCEVRISTHETGAPCPKADGDYTVRFVGPCVKGTRTLTNVEYEPCQCDHQGYVPKISTSTAKCGDCCADVRHQLTTCVEGVRYHNMTFFEDIDGCCKEKQLRNSYKCYPEKCQKDKLIHTVCSYGKQIATTVFHVGSACARQHFSALRECALP
ncbi:hypothetical protein Ciccas_003786 [Cichlidogyrus casuarinus]|uniref:Apple domain-containing protein n=1 Tax=Cichlidogyrus casuarinus TaxID=1844966 RepID=A0ABD2QGQ1_9PLAT